MGVRELADTLSMTAAFALGDLVACGKRDGVSLDKRLSDA